MERVGTQHGSEVKTPRENKENEQNSQDEGANCACEQNPAVRCVGPPRRARLASLGGHVFDEFGGLTHVGFPVFFPPAPSASDASFLKARCIVMRIAPSLM